MSHLDPLPASPAPEPPESLPAAAGLSRGGLRRGVALVVLMVLLWLVGRQVPVLWREWRALQEDRAGERASTLIGYVNIYPNPQFAARPADRVHEEGDGT